MYIARSEVVTMPARIRQWLPRSRRDVFLVFQFGQIFLVIHKLVWFLLGLQPSHDLG
jgi:hypothetical protein